MNEEAGKRGLILVDIQNDYFTGGNMELVGMEQAASRAASMLEQFRSSGDTVFHVQHLSVRPGATFFVPGTEGVETHASVAPAEGEDLIQKNFPNSFRDTDLLEKINAAAVSDLVIVGAMSHMCIDATTRAAFDLGFTCTVISDACATRDLEFEDRVILADEVHGSFMAALSAPYARVTTLEKFEL